MKCIVTGGSGFIGMHLVDELIRKNYEVLNIDIKPPILNAHIASWKERDILDNEALLTDFQSFAPVCVVHLAAGTDTLSDRVEDYAVNTHGTDNVLLAIKACNSVKPVIICSTQFVNQYRDAPRDDLDLASKLALPGHRGILA